MNYLYFKRIAASIIASLLLILSSHAVAQYVWLDDKGVKQYSNMPPPPAVPNSHILKSPGAVAQGLVPNVAPEKMPDQSDNAAAAKAKLPLTTAEKNADFQKRRLEQVEKDKKATNEAQLAADKSKNCKRATAYQKALDSGQRIAQQGKDGQRVYLSDTNRAQELRDTKRILSECK